MNEERIREIIREEMIAAHRKKQARERARLAKLYRDFPTVFTDTQRKRPPDAL